MTLKLLGKRACSHRNSGGLIWKLLLLLGKDGRDGRQWLDDGRRGSRGHGCKGKGRGRGRGGIHDKRIGGRRIGGEVSGAPWDNILELLRIVIDGENLIEPLLEGRKRPRRSLEKRDRDLPISLLLKILFRGCSSRDGLDSVLPVIGKIIIKKIIAGKCRHHDRDDAGSLLPIIGKLIIKIIWGKGHHTDIGGGKDDSQPTPEIIKKLIINLKLIIKLIKQKGGPIKDVVLKIKKIIQVIALKVKKILKPLIGDGLCGHKLVIVDLVGLLLDDVINDLRKGRLGEVAEHLSDVVELIVKLVKHPPKKCGKPQKDDKPIAVKPPNGTGKYNLLRTKLLS